MSDRNKESIMTSNEFQIDRVALGDACAELYRVLGDPVSDQDAVRKIGRTLPFREVAVILRLKAEDLKFMSD